MSESPRYSRTSGGLVGALVVTVVAVLALVGFRAVFGDDEPTPVREVDWTASVQHAREDGGLLVQAPARLPLGWKATSATYAGGPRPTWHLGLLTDHGRYVGLEESGAQVADLVAEHVDADAERGEDVAIAGATWQSWTDAGGDYAVARSLRRDGSPVESWLVVGTAPKAEIHDFAAGLEPGPDGSG